MNINLHNKKFKALNNSANGEVSDATVFHYYQENEMVWANYSGGDILKGFLIGKRKGETLEFTYQHLNKGLEIMTGKCHSEIEMGSDNKILLHEKWEWTCRDFSKGSSELKEV